MSDRPFDQLNAGYAQDLYELYARNPQAVPESWRRFFAQGPEVTTAAGLLIPEGLSVNGASGHGYAQAPAPSPSTRSAVQAAVSAEATAEADKARMLLPLVALARQLVQAFRDHGHMLAHIDPLG